MSSPNVNAVIAAMLGVAEAYRAAADALAAADSLSPAPDRDIRRATTLTNVEAELDRALDRAAGVFLTGSLASTVQWTDPAPSTVATLAEYETAMRTAYPSIPAGVSFGDSYGGFLASGLSVTAWIGLTQEERRSWTAKATTPAPKAEPAPAAAPTVTESAPAVTAAKPAPAVPPEPKLKSAKGSGFAKYRKLREECKRAGLSAKGSAAELATRLEKHKANQPAAPKPAPAAARETTAPKATAPAGLVNGTHQALARKLGVEVADLVDALNDLGPTLSPTTK